MDPRHEEITRFFNRECKEDPQGKVKSKDLYTLYKPVATFFLVQRQFTILFAETFPKYQRTYTSKATTFYGFSLRVPLPKAKPREAKSKPLEKRAKPGETKAKSNYEAVKKNRKLRSPSKIRMPQPIRIRKMDLHKLPCIPLENSYQEIAEKNPDIKREFVEKVQTFPPRIQKILEPYYKYKDSICWVMTNGRLDMKATLLQTIETMNVLLEMLLMNCQDVLSLLETIVIPEGQENLYKDRVSWFWVKFNACNFPRLSRQDVGELNL